MYIIIVSGTPGTGKTSISTILASILGCTPTSATRELMRVQGATRDPTGRLTLLATDEGLRRASQKLRLTAEEGRCIVLETVFPRDWYELLSDMIPVIVLLRAHPFTLRKRLEERGWPEDKIIENVAAEAFNVIAEELSDISYDVIEADTTYTTPEEASTIVIKKIINWDTGIRIDWTLEEAVAHELPRLLLRLDSDKYRLGI